MILFRHWKKAHFKVVNNVSKIQGFALELIDFYSSEIIELVFSQHNTLVTFDVMIKKGRFVELDAFRGIAAIFVCVFHYFFFRLGCTGVDLFFLISGFVIFFSVEKNTSYKHFLYFRFARLFPAYWVCLSITTMSIVVWIAATKQALQSVFFIKYMVNLTMFQELFGIDNVDGVYWTLLREWYFYVFILILLLTKMLKNIEIISIAVVAICLINQILFKYCAPVVYHNLHSYFPIVSNFPLFLAGVTFYKIKSKGVTFKRLFIIAFAFLTQVQLFEYSNAHPLLTWFEYGSMNLVYFTAFFLFVFERLAFIANAVTLFLGKISYSLYLIHNYIFVFILLPILTNSKYFHLSKAIATFGIALPLAIVIASIINRFVEVTSAKYLKERWNSIYHKTV